MAVLRRELWQAMLVLALLCSYVSGGVGGTTALYTSSALSSANAMAAVAAFTVTDLAISGQAAFTLTWTDLGWPSGYNMFRGTTSGGPYSQLAAPTSSGVCSGGACTYTD